MYQSQMRPILEQFSSTVANLDLSNVIEKKIDENLLLSMAFIY